MGVDPLIGIRQAHAVVIISISNDAVTMYDPEFGERSIPHPIFSVAWALRHNLAVLIER